MKIGKMIGATAHSTYKRDANDYYATDPNALKLFLNQLERDRVSLNKQIWEPACGEGNLSNYLESRGYSVLCTDIEKRGEHFLFDFLSPAPAFLKWTGDILTNPPYKHAQEFIETALNRVSEGRKVVMLLRVQFLESRKRHDFFKQNPPKYVYVNSARIQTWLNNDNSIKSSAMCFAWFVWVKGYQGETILRWISPK